MALAVFDRICRRLTGATLVIQWSDSHVYKIGAKMFALGNEWDGEPAFVFKTTPLVYQMLLEQGIATQAPHLPRGNWVRVRDSALTQAELADYIGQSYRIVAAGLSHAARRRLGVD